MRAKREWETPTPSTHITDLDTFDGLDKSPYPIKSPAVDKYDIEGVSTDCLFPFAVSNRSDGSTLVIPCGKCLNCRTRNRNIWFTRLGLEIKYCEFGSYFVTLTYDDDHVPFDDAGRPRVLRRDIQLFLKRLRKSIHPHTIRYYGIAEYGPKTHRPHYHLFLFNWPPGIDPWINVIDAWGKCDNITLSVPTQDRIMYCARFHTDKGYTPPDLEPTFTFMSTRPGIGAAYAYDPVVRKLHDVSTIDGDRRPYVTLSDGIKAPLGRYLRDKLYLTEYGEKIDWASVLPRRSLPTESVSARRDAYHLQVERYKKRLASSRKL